MAKTKKQRAKHAERMALAKRDLAKRGKVTLAADPWDHGAMGQANRHGLVVEERGEVDPETGKVTNPNRVTGVRRVDMLDLYLKRQVISPRAHAAGTILRNLWLRTQVGTCAPWLRERVDSSPNPDAAVAIQIDRLSALVRVRRLVPCEDEAILDMVCGQGAGVGSLPEYRAHNHRKGLAHLSAALDALADRMDRVR